MDYTVIVVSNAHTYVAAKEMKEDVKNHINWGWKPLGGVSVSQTDDGKERRVVLAQAMIRE